MTDSEDCCGGELVAEFVIEDPEFGTATRSFELVPGTYKLVRTEP